MNQTKLSKPTNSTDEKKPVRVTFWLNKELRKFITELANEQYMSISEWLRKQLYKIKLSREKTIKENYAKARKINPLSPEQQEVLGKFAIDIWYTYNEVEAMKFTKNEKDAMDKLLFHGYIQKSFDENIKAISLKRIV